MLRVSAAGAINTFPPGGMFAVDSYTETSSRLGNNCDRSLEIGGCEIHRRSKCSHTPL